MRMGDILVARGLVTPDDIDRAILRQRTEGGRLGDNLITLGKLTLEQLEAVIRESPPSPRNIAETGLPANMLTGLLCKFMLLQSRETASDLGEAMHLPPGVTRALLEDAGQRKLIEAMGSTGGGGIGSQIRYVLTAAGRQTATEALERSLYLGPAPVPLAMWKEQILRQRITNERIDPIAFKEAFHGMIVPDWFLRKIGPAVNAGRTVLLYGPPGNGKTTVATRVSKIFKHVIYVPYAVEIEGMIMQLYDPTVHMSPMSPEVAAAMAAKPDGVRREEFDLRWVPCRRPVVVAGGELTLEMLDLAWSEDAKFYEAPLHVKALNGTMIIDDFGRQLVTPEKLLNRWIVPMESRVEFLKLHTGKSFSLPFDELLFFSTNLQPEDLMDGAFLRRIPYKIELYEPSEEDYKAIFKIVARSCGLEMADDVMDMIIDELVTQNNLHLAYYQPKFICDQVIAACKYDGEKPHFSREKVFDALCNLYVHIARKHKETLGIANETYAVAANKG